MFNRFELDPAEQKRQASMTSQQQEAYKDALVFLFSGLGFAVGLPVTIEQYSAVRLTASAREQAVHIPQQIATKPLSDFIHQSIYYTAAGMAVLSTLFTVGCVYGLIRWIPTVRRTEKQLLSRVPGCMRPIFGLQADGNQPKPKM